MVDYMPPADGQFDPWQDNFVSYANANLAALGLTAPDMAPITAAQTLWNSSYGALAPAKAAAENAVAAKRTAKTNYMALLRALVKRLQADSRVSDAEKASLRITVPGTNPPAPEIPTTRPLVAVDTAQRFSHTLSFADESTPTRRAKPLGVHGIELWAKIGGTPPVSAAELQYMGTDTKTAATLSFTGVDGNKSAYYWCRWVGDTGKPGPWSEVAVATIAA